MKLSAEAIDDMCKQALWKSPDELPAFVKERATCHRVSTRRIRQLLASIRHIKRRRAVGNVKRKIELSDQQWNYLVGLRMERSYAAWHAIEIAEAEGVIEKGTISPALLNRRLFEDGLGYARITSDRKPARRIVRSGVNVLAHEDWTKREELFIDANRVVYFAPKKRKNQHGEKLPSIWLASGMDDYSRAAYMHFYLDENAENQCDFLRRWFSEKERPEEFPVHGLYSQIYMDCGPVNMSAPVQSLIRGLGTFVVPTKPSTWGPYDARKHGKIERLFRTFDEYFKELPDLLPMHFDELQDWLYQKLLHYNNRVHSVTGETPFVRWAKIANIKRAPSPEMFAFLCQTHHPRTVNKHLMISLDGNHFHLDQARDRVRAANKRIEDLVGEKIEVFYSFENFSAVTVVYPGYPDMPLTKCENSECHATPTPEWEPTAIDLKRAEVSTIDFKRKGRPGAADRAPAFLPREGVAFDETRVATKFVIDAKGNRMPSREEELVFDNWAAAAPALMKLGIFASPPSDADKAWLQGVISARVKIAADELLAMAQQYKAEQGVVMADGDQQD